jgi:hypothetical protein
MVTAKLIGQLNDDVRKDGARLIVVAVTNDFQVHTDHLERMQAARPAMTDMDWDWLRPNKILREITAEQGIEFIDLVDEFRATAKRESRKYLHTFAGHWTAEGHALCARILFEHLAGQSTIGEKTAEIQTGGTK